MRIEEFDYELPAELVAQHPPTDRAASRLLHLSATAGEISDAYFAELPRFLRPGDLMVLNDTRVIKARLQARKPTGGKMELMIERVLDSRTALAMLRASHPPRAGEWIDIGGAGRALVRSRQSDLFELQFEEEVLPLLDRVGLVPLPPYIARSPSTDDEARYQTVYAREHGAVAAPTAGLHFDQAMLDRVRHAGVQLVFVTLHVGAGTFQPVRTQRIEEHVMHSEWYRIPQETTAAVARTRSEGGRVLAVGTTSLRALESAHERGKLRAGSAQTRLFIYPGYRFRVVDLLLTNFHLPRSTLLMLVAAFAGLDNVRRAYRHAVEQRYRFFSYGDAMLIERARHSD
ncbi:MAG: tRNA preQ1(34) S-adenosylmethionine ribosyltransferase-isomerase QueA [Burkholderiales bacterium]